MNKLILAMTVFGDRGGRSFRPMPRLAMPRRLRAHKMFATSPGATIRAGDQCWKQTDGGRG